MTTASLLEVSRALDGNKADRFNVAFAALTVAYTVSLQHGNSTQLQEVLKSTGKKVCERAMRQAVQTVGIPGKHKDATTRQETIESLVIVAADIFASIACKDATPKAKPVKTVEPVASIVPAVMTPRAVTEYAATLDDAHLASLIDALTKEAMKRSQQMKKAA